MAKKTYVLDTSVYLTDANAIYEYGNNDIVVPLKVLEELDKHKIRQDAVGHQARRTIRILDALRERSGGNLQKGIRLEKGKGIIKVAPSDISLLPDDLESDVPDNKIISTALAARIGVPSSRKVILVTKDINMRVVCDSIGLQCETYDPEKAVADRDQLYTGYSEILVDEEYVDRFYKGEVTALPEGIEDSSLFPNEFLMFRAAGNHKKTALARYMGNGEAKSLIPKVEAWGVRPRNREQTFALELLLDPKVPIVSLVGKAGSGKTLCAIAAGLQQTLNGTQYNKLVVSRPVQPLGKDLGFLPGDVNEKMLPWLMPIQDNLQFLMGNDRETLEQHILNGTIEIEALTYIRGRSISKAFIIIDEAQNLTMHELKTIITRVGEGTKIILTGDIEQIDNVHITDVTNGLTHAVEKFKDTDLAGHVTLTKGERSAVASLAAKIL